MRYLSTFVRGVERISEGVGSVVSWLTTLLVAVVCFDVATRYLFNFTLVAVQEAQWHVFGTLFLLGASFTLKHDRHVRVDVLYTNFSPRLKAWVNLLGTVLFLVPFCLLGIKLGWDYTQASLAASEGSPNPGGLPARYALKAMIPLGFFLLLIQGLAGAARSASVLTGAKLKPAAEEPPHVGV